VQTRVLGAEHPDTLVVANNLAQALANQVKYVEAERIHREVLGVNERVLGAEHRVTLACAANVASILARQGKHADAERIHSRVHGVQTRVLGAEHPETLMVANNLGSALSNQGKYVKAERIQRDVLGVRTRVLGAEHPDTLESASYLANTLAAQGKLTEAEQMLQATLASFQRVLGPTHPLTLATARHLEVVRTDCATPPTYAAAPAAAGAARSLPAGTRVRVQRLVAKPEHNGKCARVLSFDECTGRYVVALDDGKELSLKAECVARTLPKMAGGPHGGGACVICLDTSPPPIQSGCACRGDAGLAHIECLAQVAASKQSQLDGIENRNEVWSECQTCKQTFTGAMRMGLAEAWRSQVVRLAAGIGERLDMEGNLASSLLDNGKYAEAEAVLRKLHDLSLRVGGANSLSALKAAGDLASSLVYQGKYADGERMQREVLEANIRMFGAEHPDTLMMVGNLAMTLIAQDKLAEAQTINRELLLVRKRVSGSEHPFTLMAANNLAANLSKQGEVSEAQEIWSEVLGVQKRVLGPEHPHTLSTMGNLAGVLSDQGKYAEAEPLLEAALSSQLRVLGPDHPVTQGTAICLTNVRASFFGDKCAKPPTEAAAAGGTRLPAGTRVLVQRLVAKPEHNGKLASVVAFDARTGRYGVVLDDGTNLSIKPECVSRAGCAAAGCASEEASSMCSRCKSVRYCSRECQRTDWKTHKPACAAEHTSS
jgi:tetratricopeptide (TPR) repeat protein